MNQQAGLLAGAQADLEKHENSRDSQLWLCRIPTLQGFNPGELAEMLAEVERLDVRELPEAGAKLGRLLTQLRRCPDSWPLVLP